MKMITKMITKRKPEMMREVLFYTLIVFFLAASVAFLVRKDWRESYLMPIILVFSSIVLFVFGRKEKSDANPSETKEPNNEPKGHDESDEIEDIENQVIVDAVSSGPTDDAKYLDERAKQIKQQRLRGSKNLHD